MVFHPFILLCVVFYYFSLAFFKMLHLLISWLILDFVKGISLFFKLISLFFLYSSSSRSTLFFVLSILFFMSLKCWINLRLGFFQQFSSITKEDFIRLFLLADCNSDFIDFSLMCTYILIVMFLLIIQFSFLFCHFVRQFLEFIHGVLQVLTTPVDNIFQVFSYLLDRLFIHKL